MCVRTKVLKRYFNRPLRESKEHGIDAHTLFARTDATSSLALAGAHSNTLTHGQGSTEPRAAARLYLVLFRH